MIKSLQLWYWRRQLKKRYLAMRTIADNYSCGHNLLLHVSLSYNEAIVDVNEAIRRVKELDPACTLKEIEIE